MNEKSSSGRPRRGSLDASEQSSARPLKSGAGKASDKRWHRQKPGGHDSAGRQGRPGRQSRLGNAGRKGRNTSGFAPGETEQHIFGLHAAEFALRNKRRKILEILATENAERKLADVITPLDVPVTRVTPRELDKKVGSDTVHQGIVVQVAPLATFDLADLTELGVVSRQPVVILDQVTDPHNVGAVLRSCAVFGASGLVMTQRHSPPLGGSLAKAASGALDLMPVCLVQNLAAAIGELKGQKFTVIGLDGTGDHRLLEEGLRDVADQPVAIALGAEGKGLRELTRQSCDELCRIGGDGAIASLNVSNAAAVALHLAAMLRRG